MLKKAGFIAATAAAGLLAVGSFAFADETITTDNLTNDCQFAQAAGDINNPQDGGSAGLGAVANVVGSVTAPITAQAPALNCLNLNVEDIADFDSGNTTETVTKTKVKDSFNTEAADEDDE